MSDADVFYPKKPKSIDDTYEALKRAAAARDVQDRKNEKRNEKSIELAKAEAEAHREKQKALQAERELEQAKKERSDPVYGIIGMSILLVALILVGYGCYWVIENVNIILGAILGIIIVGGIVAGAFKR